jgi:protein-tyrosine phosphatase
MSQGRENTVLFLCTGNYYRSRFAEIFFNAVAVKEGLCWRADSRGLAVGRSGTNVGPMAALAIQVLDELGMASNQPLRFPVQVQEDDLHRADLIVAVKEAEHRSLLQEQFPAWADRVEYWHVHDLDFATHEEALPHIQQEVLRLVNRLRNVRRIE